MKKLLEEFKTFALKGNVLDMAVGVVVGGGDPARRQASAPAGR